MSRPHLVAILCLASMLSACSSSNRALSESADAFFTAVASGDLAHAHRYLSRKLTANTTVEELGSFMLHTGLANPGSRHWKDSQVDEKHGVLEGEVEVDGQTLPVRLTLVKEDVHWKIDGLARGVRIAKPSGEYVLFAPTDSENARLAQATMEGFAAAVQRNDLAGYWASMANVFRHRYSVEQFEAAFGGFVRDGTNLSPAAKLAPRFTAPPTLEPDGELVLRGLFPTRPSEVVFEYRYVFQDGDWTNSGNTITLVPRG